MLHFEISPKNTVNLKFTYLQSRKGIHRPHYNILYSSTSLQQTPLSYILLFHFKSKYPSRYYIFPFTSNSFHFHHSLNASGFTASKKNTICTIFWEKNVFKSEWTFLELFQRSEKKTFFRKQLAFVIEIQLDFDTSLFVGSYWLAQKKKLMAS